MYKLYKISGCGQNFSMCEYKCPKIEKKIDIEIPDEIINNTALAFEDIEKLFQENLIDEILYLDIEANKWEETVYYIAVLTKKGWASRRLKHVGNRLVGKAPKTFDKYSFKVYFYIYAVLYFLLGFWLLGKLMEALGMK